MSKKKKKIGSYEKVTGRTNVERHFSLYIKRSC